MRRVVLVFAVVFLSAVCGVAQTRNPKPVQTIPVSQIHAGMRGVAYTVFQGTEPESMGVEVLGVLKNANGPKGDIILVRLSGTKAEYTGAVAGVGGEPDFFGRNLGGGSSFPSGE